jgi:type II secretory pathway component PulC
MSNRLSERQIMALNYLLITILAYFAALAANDILVARSRSDGFVVHSVSRAVEPAPSHSRSDYQAIVDRDIFNLTPVVVAAPPPVIEDLHLTLIGVSRMSKGQPFAIIEDQRGVQAVYRVGETIPDSGKLIAVEKDRAVVEHDGQNVVIQLPKDELTSAPGLRRLGTVGQVEEPDQGSEPDQPIDSSTDPGQEPDPD